ncbi:MAG: tetratricopeptide repeat protein, partial [Sciscionella sp.]
MTTRLKAVRGQLGYKAEAVIGMLADRAHQLNISVMSASSLKTKLSEWENGHSTVSDHYRRLFRDIYGRT